MLEAYTNNKWVSFLNCNISVNYIVKSGSGSLVTYVIANYITVANNSNLILTFTRQGYSGYIVFNADFSQYVGQGKKLHIYLKSSTNSWTDVNIRSSANNNNNSNVSYYQVIHPGVTEQEIVLNIDSVFNTTYKYLCIAANPSSAGQTIIITNIFVK